jgi:hypothetical protein
LHEEILGQGKIGPLTKSPAELAEFELFRELNVRNHWRALFFLLPNFI